MGWGVWGPSGFSDHVHFRMMHTCTCTIQPTACGLLGGCIGSGLSKTSVWICMETILCLLF